MFIRDLIIHHELTVYASVEPLTTLHAPPHAPAPTTSSTTTSLGSGSGLSPGAGSSDMDGRILNRFVFQNNVAGFLLQSGDFISMDEC